MTVESQSVGCASSSGSHDLSFPFQGVAGIWLGGPLAAFASIGKTGAMASACENAA